MYVCQCLCVCMYVRIHVCIGYIYTCTSVYTHNRLNISTRAFMHTYLDVNQHSIYIYMYIPIHTLLVESGWCLFSKLQDADFFIKVDHPPSQEGTAEGANPVAVGSSQSGHGKLARNRYDGAEA